MSAIAVESFDVFISFAHADSEDLAVHLRDDLEKHGLSAWLDRDDLRSRGLPWQAEVRDSVDRTERLIAIVSPRALSSPHVQAEWDTARRSGHVVIPVLHGDVPKKLPGVLASTALEIIDFRDSSEDAYGRALAKLVRDTKTPAPRLGVMHYVPYPPPNLFTRTEELARVQDLVLKHPVTVIHGMGGLGKSVIAAQYAWEAETRRAFDDGIVWLDAGIEGDRVLENLYILAQALESPSRFVPEVYRSAIEAPQALKRLLTRKTTLIVIDDARDVKSVKPITELLGPRCQILVTTRDKELAPRLQAVPLELEFLEPRAARDLLSRWWQHPPSELPPEADEIVERCHGLPLALAMIGAMVADPDAPYGWSDALRALKDAAQQTLTSRFDYKYESLNSSISASVKAVGFHEDRYLFLGVFQDDTPIPEATLRTYWAPMGLSEWDTKQVLELFVKRSLLYRRVDGAVTAHDLQLDYARYEADKTPRGLAVRHRTLVEAYGGECTGEWARGPRGPVEGRNYYFRYLSYHMRNAEMMSDLESLLRDPDFLRAKREVTSHREVVEDYENFAEFKGLERCAVDELFPFSSPGTSESKVSILRELALSYELLGHRMQAEKVLLRADSLAVALDDKLLRAGILTQLGISRFHRGAFELSSETLTEARGIYEQVEGTLSQQQLGDYAECLDWNAELYRNVSDYDAALPLHRRARDVARQARDGRRETHAIANIGAVHYWRKDYATALDHWKDCLAISKRLLDRAGEVHYTIDVGYMTFLVRHDREAYEESLRLLEEGIDLARQGQFEEEYSRALMNKGSLLFVSASKDRLSEVEKLYREALEISNRDDIARLTWRLYHNLGNVLRRRGDLDEARSAYGRAIELVLKLRISNTTDKERGTFLVHRMQPFQSMMLVSLLQGDSDAARALANEHCILFDYLARREKGIDLEREEREGGNHRFFRLDGEDYYVETE